MWKISWNAAIYLHVPTYIEGIPHGLNKACQWHNTNFTRKNSRKIVSLSLTIQSAVMLIRTAPDMILNEEIIRDGDCRKNHENSVRANACIPYTALGDDWTPFYLLITGVCSASFMTEHRQTYHWPGPIFYLLFSKVSANENMHFIYGVLSHCPMQ